MTLRLGRYETLRAIASGGMATVHLARVLGVGGFERLVAVKAMHPHIATDPEFVAMFLDEARLAARVRHPNVVATIDVQEDPLFLVMEYIEGPSLQAVFKETRKAQRPLDLAVGLRVFLDILAGLHAAHELTGTAGEPLNLVHRDVSPHNLLIGVDGIARITDFGVARAESRLSSTRGGQIKGKLAYMAPEQIRSEPVDRRCDVYSAGVVLWEILGNQGLIQADNDGAMLAQVLAGAQRSPRTIQPTVPAAIDAVCMRALRISPGQRFPTAAAFADALEDAAEASGTSIATPRAVSSMVKALAIHQAPPTSGPGLDAPASRSGDSSSSRRVGPSATNGDVPPRPSSTGGSRRPPDLPKPEHGTSVGTVLAASAPPTEGSRWRIPLVLAATLLFGATAVVFVMLGNRVPIETVTDASHAGALEPPSAPAFTVSAAALEPEVPPSAAAPDSSASAEPAPSQSAAAASARPGARTPPRVRPPAAPPKPPADATSFRPSDL